jgi:D-3-phosphoglycerate dehydrogenase
VAHRGGWLKSAENAYEIRGKTLGIVGYGSIGTQLSVLAEALGMQVAFYDVVNKLPLGNARQVAKLHDLLAQSDIVSLHVPELPSTAGDDRRGRNCGHEARRHPHQRRARHGGGDRALADALKAKKLLGAAIDVFPVEPRTNKDEFQSPLRGLDNVILTPHIGGSTMEAQANIGTGSGRKAGEVQRQRHQHLVGQLPRGGAARAPRQAPPAAHPPQRAGRAVEINRIFPTTRSTSRPSTCRPTRRSAMW